MLTMDGGPRLLCSLDPAENGLVFGRILLPADAASVRQHLRAQYTLRFRTRSWLTEDKAVLRVAQIHDVHRRPERRVEQRVRCMTMHASVAIATAFRQDRLDVC